MPTNTKVTLRCTTTNSFSVLHVGMGRAVCYRQLTFPPHRHLLTRSHAHTRPFQKIFWSRATVGKGTEPAVHNRLLVRQMRKSVPLLVFRQSGRKGRIGMASPSSDISKPFKMISQAGDSSVAITNPSLIFESLYSNPCIRSFQGVQGTSNLRNQICQVEYNRGSGSSKVSTQTTGIMLRNSSALAKGNLTGQSRQGFLREESISRFSS